MSSPPRPRLWGQAFAGLVILALSVLALGVVLGLFDEPSGGEAGAVAAPSATVSPQPAEPVSEQPADAGQPQAVRSVQPQTVQPEPAQPETVQPQPAQPEPAQTPRSGLPTIAEADLPPEAWDTMQLIYDGGPFPFRQDDTTFFNREGILPRQPRDYYREYTVRTPRSPDRGARRIVAGAAGDLFYTQDHYDSFRQIEESR